MTHDINIDEFKQALWSGRLSRRDIVKIFAAAGVVMTTVPLSAARRSARAQDDITLFTWTGYDDPEFYPSYVETHGGPPSFALYGDEEEALLKMKGGFDPDVVMPCSYKVQKWYDAGVLESIDTSRLSNWGDIFESLRSMDVVEIDGKTVWVPADWGQTSVLYRTDLAPEYVGNESWNILWDPKYAGRLAMMDSLIDGVAVAAIVAGIDPFNITDDQIEIVRDKLAEQRPLLRFYSNDLTSMEQALASGELVAATLWNQSYVTLKSEGHPVAFMNPKEKAMTWVCGVSIVKGTKSIDKAHDLIDAFLDPRSRAKDITEFGYGSATKGGFDLVDDATLADVGLPRDPTEMLQSGLFQLPMANEEKLQMMFESVKAGA
jgi:spermidine/putrescine transport system substrate-binding protein